MPTAREFITKYQLKAHPEGGYFRETYRSAELIPVAGLPDRFNGPRHFSTAIYFLLEGKQFSAFHRIRSDECWHFYAGQTLHVYVLDDEGELETIKLGSNSMEGELFQYVVPAGCWFASKPAPGSQFCFVGCTVAPGFDFADFELADARRLAEQYPQHTGLITELCR